MLKSLSKEIMIKTMHFKPVNVGDQKGV